MPRVAVKPASKGQIASDTLALQLSKLYGLTVAREYRFHGDRLWRFDGAIELMQVHTPSSRMRYDNM